MSCKKFDAVRFDSHGTFQASALLRQRRQRTSSGPSPRMCYTKHKVVALELGEVYNIVCYMEFFFFALVQVYIFFESVTVKAEMAQIFSQL